MLFRKVGKLSIFTLSMIFYLDSALAAGFYIQEQSITGLGKAFSGEVAYGGDASVLWYNPAASTSLKGHHFGVGLSVINLKADVENKNSNLSYPALSASFPVNGDKKDPFSPEIIPNLYFLWSLSDKTKLGFSVNFPYGLEVEYDKSWFGRYDSTRSELKTVNNQFSIAHDFGIGISLGVGINIQYAKAILENALPNIPPVSTADGSLKIEGDDVSFGYNIGVTLEPIKNLVFGIHYRSRIEHDLEGAASFSDLSTVLAPFNNHIKGKAPLKMPDILSLGLVYSVSQKSKVFLQIDRFGWSSVDAIQVYLNNGTQLTSELDYKDVYRIAAGMEFQASPKWLWRMGVQWDPTPTRTNFRSTRIPDADRTWLTSGFSYYIRDNIRLDTSLALYLCRRNQFRA